MSFIEKGMSAEEKNNFRNTFTNREIRRLELLYIIAKIYKIFYSIKRFCRIKLNDLLKTVGDTA